MRQRRIFVGIGVSEESHAIISKAATKLKVSKSEMTNFVIATFFAKFSIDEIALLVSKQRTIGKVDLISLFDLPKPKDYVQQKEKDHA